MPNEIDLALMDPILERYKGQEDALITIMQELQQAYAYLPEEALVRLGREAHVPLSRIYAVVTFYAQFYLTPRGRNTVRVCQGTACHVQGCESIVSAVEEELGIGVGGTTEDRQFSVESVACLGTCFLAPVMMINDSYYGKLDPQQTKVLIRGCGHDRRES
ncbi:MAG: NADH-quinone oxidoreductase subunit NuoE [Dehalococcoidia bacterium]|nr:NADH-quinone oxidoreductase subunit NuoE [Dehalococcoidia bacterium]